MTGMMMLALMTAPSQQATIDDDKWAFKKSEQGYEYIIQIEPEVMQRMTVGEPAFSHLNENNQRVNFSRVRLTYGNQKLDKSDVMSVQGLADVTSGYRPIQTGGIEFIVQIPPPQADAFIRGTDVIVDIPVVARNIKRFMVQIGTNDLPRVPETQAQPVVTPPAPVADPTLPIAPIRTNVPNQPAPVQPINTRPLAGSPYNTQPPYGATNPLAPAPSLAPQTPISPYGTGLGPRNTQPINVAPQQPTTLVSAPDPIEERRRRERERERDYAEGYQDAVQKIVEMKDREKPEPFGTPPRASTTPGVNNVSAGIGAQAANTPPQLANKEPIFWTNFLTSMALFASLGANVFLGWVAMGLYDRYRRVLTDMRDQSRRVVSRA